MVKAGLGIVGLLIIIFSTVTTTFLDAYSAGISSETLSHKLNGKYIAIGVTIVGALAAIVYPMDNITDFLYLIGSVFAPMIAIQIGDFFLLKEDHSEKEIQISNMILWVIGFVLYRMLMKVDLPVGNTLPDMVITMVLCLIWEKWLERKISKKSIINEMFRKRCRQKKLLTLLFFMRTVCQSVKQREKAHTFGERYTPCVRKM